eukprot:gnl/MRDRNA2_/MRDRNA2_42279_c0_seq2.p1 gnl/MRDRNA2_/MRDRNA2_42279_c0~~gnl/MRDRNA2_/MRDRNA2_42279_c0_seq2.p1  ORF type:complete len:104 (-),score=10.98 gnl/MRDRNA2_/MRDRNA2_42279_c0_seq2:55-366(-)
MWAEKLLPDTISYNATISAQGKRWERALELLKDCATWATPDTISYSAAITTCEKARQQERAEILLQAMRAQRIQPDTASYGAAISACGTCWDHALELLNDCRT